MELFYKTTCLLFIATGARIAYSVPRGNGFLGVRRKTALIRGRISKAGICGSCHKGAQLKIKLSIILLTQLCLIRCWLLLALKVPGW